MSDTTTTAQPSIAELQATVAEAVSTAMASEREATRIAAEAAAAQAAHDTELNDLRAQLDTATAEKNTAIAAQATAEEALAAKEQADADAKTAADEAEAKKMKAGARADEVKAIEEAAKATLFTDEERTSRAEFWATLDDEAWDGQKVDYTAMATRLAGGAPAPAATHSGTFVATAGAGGLSGGEPGKGLEAMRTISAARQAGFDPARVSQA